MLAHGLGAFLVQHALTNEGSKALGLCQRVDGILFLDCVDHFSASKPVSAIIQRHAEYESKDESLPFNLLLTQLQVVRQNFDIFWRRSYIEVTHFVGALSEKTNLPVQSPSLVS